MNAGKKNGGPPPHIHTREDEVYLVKRGTFQFFMDGICRQAGPGATGASGS